MRAIEQFDHAIADIENNSLANTEKFQKDILSNGK